MTQANDMFSLGCLAYAVHNKGVPLLHTFNNLRTYERKIQALGTMDFSHMPVHLQGTADGQYPKSAWLTDQRDRPDVIRRLLARYPSQRISSIEFQNSKYFDNLLVSTMKFLENFPEKTREEKGQFMKGLARVLNQFPERVLKRKVGGDRVNVLSDVVAEQRTIDPSVTFGGTQEPSTASIYRAKRLYHRTKAHRERIL